MPQPSSECAAVFNRRLRRARSPVTKDRTEFIRSVVLPHLYCALIARFRRYEAADDPFNSAPLSANWSRNDTGCSSGRQCRCASTHFASALAASKTSSPSREFGTILATSRVNAFLSNIIRTPAVSTRLCRPSNGPPSSICSNTSRHWILGAGHRRGAGVKQPCCPSGWL